MPLAEWWQRLVARIIDILVMLVPVAILMAAVLFVWVTASGGVMAGSSFHLGSGQNLVADMVSGVLMVALLTVYETLMLSRSGRTVGKIAMGLRVVPLDGSVRDNGGLPTNTALIRGLVWWGPDGLNWLPLAGGMVATLFPLVNGLWPLWDTTPYRQSLNDKAAGTAVVVDR